MHETMLRWEPTKELGVSTLHPFKWATEPRDSVHWQSYRRWFQSDFKPCPYRQRWPAELVQLWSWASTVADARVTPFAAKAEVEGKRFRTW